MNYSHWDPVDLVIEINYYQQLFLKEQKHSEKYFWRWQDALKENGQLKDEKTETETESQLKFYEEMYQKQKLLAEQYFEQNMEARLEIEERKANGGQTLAEYDADMVAYNTKRIRTADVMFVPPNDREVEIESYKPDDDIDLAEETLKPAKAWINGVLTEVAG